MAGNKNSGRYKRGQSAKSNKKAKSKSVHSENQNEIKIEPAQKEVSEPILNDVKTEAPPEKFDFDSVANSILIESNAEIEEKKAVEAEKKADIQAQPAENQNAEQNQKAVAVQNGWQEVVEFGYAVAGEIVADATKMPELNYTPEEMEKICPATALILNRLWPDMKGISEETREIIFASFCILNVHRQKFLKYEELKAARDQAQKIQNEQNQSDSAQDIQHV